MMIKNVFSILCFCLLTMQVVAQKVTKKELQERAEQLEIKDKAELDVFFQKNPEQSRIIMLADGEIMMARYLDATGKPIYYKVYNADAAEGTRITSVRDGIALGKKLSGQGVPLAVWDGGLILSDHREFIGRVEQKDIASSLSNHANHVTGTILATGINPSAKGMSPLANASIYSFDNDFSEMTVEANNGLVLSNHSYGEVLGWSFSSSANEWSWQGVASVSPSEDYRFGLYTNRSVAWDDLAYANPYYLMVKSAGNDRGDRDPSETFPPADGPYDIIGPVGVAKNILTVGAVNKITGDINDPSNISMTSFSSWGPTDDGRIKPDLVGIGRSLLSVSSSSTSSYSILSGTSMSAPNVTGGLALLQEFAMYKRNDYLKSATLKGLAIHAVTPTGGDYGPDYSYGWGLFNAEKSAKIIDNAASDSKIGLLEATLADGAVNEYTVSLDAGDELITTICWTDLSGDPETEAVLDPTTLRLVHDLDLRVEEVATGQIFEPYILDPATKELSVGDNFRDNVEKIRFTAPNSGSYIIRVSHKGNLEEATQDFALVYSVESSIGEYNVLYFTGENQDFDELVNFADEDNNPALALPSSKTVLYVDSDRVTGNFAQLDADLQLKALVINGSSSTALEIDLNGHNIYAERIISNDIPVRFINGKVIITSNDGVSVNALFDGNISLIIDAPKIELERVVGVSNLKILNGEIINNELVDVALKVDSLEVMSGVTSSNIEFDIEVYSYFSNQSSTFTLGDSRLLLKGDVSFLSNVNDESFLSLELDGAVDIQSALVVDSLLVVASSQVTVSGNLQGNVLSLLGNASLEIGGGNRLEILDFINISDGVEIDISSAGVSNGVFAYQGSKICDVPFNVDRVDYEGKGKLVLGSAQTIANATGWLDVACEDVLEAAFTFESPCAPGDVFFFNATDGLATSWSWKVSNASDEFTSTNENPTISLADAGTYDVTLIVANSIDTDTLETTIDIKGSTLAVPVLRFEDGMIISSQLGSKYRWFHNGELLIGFVASRITPPFFSGSYQVEITFQGCVIRSEDTPFLTLDEEDLLREGLLKIYPNPIQENGILNIDLRDRNIEYVELVTADGRIVQRVSTKSRQVELSFLGQPKGVYLIRINDGNKVFTYKVLY